MKKLYLLLILLWGLTTNAQENADSTVPVRLKTLQASGLEMGNKLHWTVSCFLNHALFEVQRSSDGSNYSTINTFKADNLRCKQPFDYEDKTAIGKVYYRIRVGDLDGKYYNSKIVVINGKQKGFDIAAMYPTVVTSKATVSITSANSDKADIQVYSMQGNKVLFKKAILSSGSNDVIIDFANLSKGKYILAIQNSENKLSTVQFIKQ